MRILVTGANGFIGSNVVAALLAAGHQVVCAVRDVAGTAQRFPQCEIIAVDFNRDISAETWLPRLQGIDAVVNCAGILRGTKQQSIEHIHVTAPCALYSACVQANIKAVVHISALGIAGNKDTEYATTKSQTDAFLLNLPLNAVILRPSLVVATGSYGGTSLFRGLAALPGVIPIIGDGQQLMQPIAMEDLANTIVQFVSATQLPKQVVEVVGPEAIPIRDLLIQWRAWLGFSQAKILSVPLWLIGIVATLGEWLGMGPLNKTSFRMLQRPNVGDYQKFRSLINFTPKTFLQMLTHHPSYVQDRWQARLYFLRPLLIFVIGLMWVMSGILPLLGDQQDALLWMQQLGIADQYTTGLLYGVSIMDILIGLATWWCWQYKRLIPIQIIIIMGYTVLATIATPSLWLNVYGPLLKNIPILVAILIMAVLENDR